MMTVSGPTYTVVCEHDGLPVPLLKGLPQVPNTVTLELALLLGMLPSGVGIVTLLVRVVLSGAKGLTADARTRNV